MLQATTTIPALGYIRNVRAAQLWPHKKIAFQYEIADDVSEIVTGSTALKVTGTYGSTTKTATSAKLYGDKACTPGVHHAVWDVEGDSITHSQSSMNFSLEYGAAKADATCWVALGSEIKDGMSINGTKKNVWCSPFVNGEGQLLIDGNVFLSSSNLYSFAWMPIATGTHTLTHKSGSYTWTRTVNVTGLAFATPAEPNPPTAADTGLTISPLTRNMAIAGGSSAITTSGNAWTASASDPWITLNATSGTAGRPVAYRVAANDQIGSRTGYVYVNGHVHTIIQAGASAGVSPTSVAQGPEGGAGEVAVEVDGAATWTVRPNNDWITVEPTSGAGSGTVAYQVAPYNEVATRSGTLTVAGETVTISQTGRAMKLAAYAEACDYRAHVIPVTVNALASTEWNAIPDVGWISIADSDNGLNRRGGSSLGVALAENPGYLPRTGTVFIGTETFTVTQAGRTQLAFAISPDRTSASVNGANGLIAVTATPDLPWTAASGANWLTLMADFAHGAGSGNVVYTASPNSTMTTRTGTITVTPDAASHVAAKTHTVTQPAATALVSAEAHVFDAAGDSFAVEVATGDVVVWSIAKSAGWVSIGGGLSRVGPGTVVVSVAGNPTVETRETTVTIAGHAFRVIQPGRDVEVDCDSLVFGTLSESLQLDIHPDGNASWTAVVSDPTWLILWGDADCDYDADGNVLGAGDATLECLVTDYVGDGTPRTGWVQIGDRKVFITQRPYDLSINPSATTVAGNAGEGSVGVPAPLGEIWNAIAVEPWITIVSGYDSGTGSGTVRFTYAENDTGAVRTGKIVIAGEVYTVTQAARQMVHVEVTAEGGLVSGGGIYDRGDVVTLRATPKDGYAFTGWSLPGGATSTANPLTFRADVDKAVTAQFRLIPVYVVNGETVREGASRTFTAPAAQVDAAGTTRLVCRGTSAFPSLGTSFTLNITADVSFAWDLWETNYLLTATASSGGRVRENGTAFVRRWVAAGGTATLVAVADSGKTFFRWTGDVEASAAGGASLPLVMDGPKTVRAEFGAWSATLADALDVPGWTFATGGDAEWQPVVDAWAQTGYTSARSGAMGSECETWMETTVTGGGELGFRWRADCEKDPSGEATWDRLTVFTNGVEAARLDGTTGWQRVTLPVSGAKTTIRWSFYRDDWDEGGPGRTSGGWVDGVTWTGTEGR